MIKRALLAVAVFGMLAVSGCTGSPGHPAAIPSATGSDPATSPTSPSPTTTKPDPPSTPAAPVPTAPAPGLKVVPRAGELPYAKRTAAPHATFQTPVHYTDGVTISITKITQGTDTSTGPGAIAGKPLTTFTVVFDNGSGSGINLNTVVVTVVYGPHALVAQSVYDATTNDLSGTVAPGKTATAVYGYSIPTAYLGNTTMGIDFSGKYTVAVFTGSAR